jgi:hypothetical protein
MFSELFERACGPVAGTPGPTAEVTALGTARGAFLRRWRLLAIDGFDIDLPACVPRNSGALEVMISALSCGNASMHASEACL